MKRLKFINCDKKISITEIEGVENKYNFKYPEEIKKHYLMICHISVVAHLSIIIIYNVL